jgi:beta-lactamase class A
MRAPVALPVILLLAAVLLPGCKGEPPVTEHTDPADAPRPSTTAPPVAREDAAWIAALHERFVAIDADTPGAVGVFVRNLDDGGTVEHEAHRGWYLSSTIKVPVAIAVLQLVEEGALSLEDELILQESDFVDGAGDMIWQEPGGRHALATLIEKSVVDSDSTATDMLVRLVGEDALNERIAKWIPGGGFGPITTILQVRYDAYGELHPGVAGLSNMDLVKLRNADAGAPRLAALVQTLGVPASELDLGSIDEAFERYYSGPRNTATLHAFGVLLEKLARRELLSEAHSALLLDHMMRITTGDRRIQSGLPKGTLFAQKTGTQLARACNVGVIQPDDRAAVVVAACVEKYDALPSAERAFQAIGEALGELVLRNR